MTMLADHPTWPKELKKDMKGEEVVFPTLAQQQAAQGIPTPPPSHQAATPVAPKPCPFCGGAMTVTYVTALGAQHAQTQVGCHNRGCIMAPTVKCDPADMPRMILMWNTRFP